jgi:hypothetical protein
MKDCYSLSPDSRGQGFGLSYDLAREQLSKISDTQEQCRKSGARYVGPNEIVINYLNKPYRIILPKDISSCHCEADVISRSNLVEVPLKDKILILHYFTMAKGTPATGILITYKQLPGGVSYFPAFSQRAINPLVKRFGQTPELLISKTAKLGGDKAYYGDASVTINAFSHVPITLVLWRGDEEVAPNGNILFDANISDYLSTEDVAVLSETIIWKLVREISSA